MKKAGSSRSPSAFHRQPAERYIHFGLGFPKADEQVVYLFLTLPRTTRLAWANPCIRDCAAEPPLAGTYPVFTAAYARIALIILNRHFNSYLDVSYTLLKPANCPEPRARIASASLIRGSNLVGWRSQDASRHYPCIFVVNHLCIGRAYCRSQFGSLND
jgi:hypothetical protein